MNPSVPAPDADPVLPAADARTAVGWMHTARFLTTAAQLNQLPPVEVPEIAFVGRSNAGKSSCINALTQQGISYSKRDTYVYTHCFIHPNTDTLQHAHGNEHLYTDTDSIEHTYCNIHINYYSYSSHLANRLLKS